MHVEIIVLLLLCSLRRAQVAAAMWSNRGDWIGSTVSARRAATGGFPKGKVGRFAQASTFGEAKRIIPVWAVDQDEVKDGDGDASELQSEPVWRMERTRL